MIAAIYARKSTDQNLPARSSAPSPARMILQTYRTTLHRASVQVITTSPTGT